MFRGQKLFLGALICLANVFVIAALLPDRSQEYEQPKDLDPTSTAKVETASQIVASQKPTLEFRRFVDEEPNGFRLAEFCFVNRSQKPVFVHEFDLLHVHSQVRVDGVWRVNQIGICGTGLWSLRDKQVKPGESLSVAEIICPPNQNYVPADGGIPGRLSPDQVSDMRVSVRYAAADGATTRHRVWSEPVNVHNEWRRVAESQENGATSRNFPPD